MPTRSLSPSVSVYTLDQNRIALGDILLTSAPSGWGSKAIRITTGAPFSHAALCVSYGLFIEAIGPGVCRLAIMATGAHAKENFRLLRLSEGVLPDAAEKANAAAKCGERYLTRGYSVAGAIGTKIAMLRNPERATLFCSQLVSRAYDEIGVQLVSGKTPETTTPGDLLKSPLLRDATESALVLVRTDEPPEYYLDDASHFERPHHWEITTKLEVLYSKPVQGVLANINEMPGSFFDLELVLKKRKDPKLDAAILAELEKRQFAAEYLQRLRKYATPAEAEKATHLVLEKIAHGIMDNDELRCIIWQSATVHKQLEEDVSHRRREYEAYHRDYGTHRLATFGYLATLQKTLLAISIEYLNAKTRELNALIPESQRRGMEPGPPH